MKKTWVEAELENLEINETANGLRPADIFDDIWVQINDLYYRPGNGKVS